MNDKTEISALPLILFIVFHVVIVFRRGNSAVLLQLPWSTYKHRSTYWLSLPLSINCILPHQSLASGYFTNSSGTTSCLFYIHCESLLSNFEAKCPKGNQNYTSKAPSLSCFLLHTSRDTVHCPTAKYPHLRKNLWRKNFRNDTADCVYFTRGCW